MKPISSAAARRWPRMTWTEAVREAMRGPSPTETVVQHYARSRRSLLSAHLHTGGNLSADAVAPLGSLDATYLQALRTGGHSDIEAYARTYLHHLATHGLGAAGLALLKSGRSW